MPRRKRGRARAARQAEAVGREVRLNRILAGLTRAEAAARAGVARSTWDRVEHGAPTVTLENLVAAADAAGLDFACMLFPSAPATLRDAGQLAMVQAILSAAHNSYRAEMEAAAGDHGEAIDLVLFGAHEILAIEVERRFLDWQLQYRRCAQKRDWLQQHHVAPVRLVIIAADTHANRRALTPFMGGLRQVLPAGSRAITDAVRSGAPLGSDGMGWMRHHVRR